VINLHDQRPWSLTRNGWVSTAVARPVLRVAALGGQVRTAAAVLSPSTYPDDVRPEAGHRGVEPGEIHPAVPR
jgi:hypothetical protein